MQADVELEGEQDAEGSASLPPGSRQRLWLDDLLAALQRCQTGPFAVAASTAAAQNLVSVLVSYALEFAFTGSVRLQKTKPLRAWSQVRVFVGGFCLTVLHVTSSCQVRPQLQNLFLAALTRGQRALPGGATSEEVLNSMISEIAQGIQSGQVLRMDSKGALHGDHAQVDALLCASTCQQCKSFVLTNNVKDIRKQPAYLACLSKLRSAFCACPDPDQWTAGTASHCEFHDLSHTLADMTWGLAQIMEQEQVIPASVPRVGAAAMRLAMKVQSEEEKQQQKAASAASGDGKAGKCQERQGQVHV